MPPPPPPPPPAPAAPAPAASSGGATTGQSVSALFAEINAKGNGITSGLRHVTDDQKLFKQKREGGPVSFEDLERKKAAAEERRQAKQREKENAERAEAARVAAEPQFELKDKRWTVANQVGTRDKQVKIVVEEGKANMTHSLWIKKCDNCFVEVSDKINSVIMIDCKKTYVKLKTIVSTAEVTNCDTVEIQVAQNLPSVMLEASHYVNIYLMHPEYSRNTEVVTAACSSVNINMPDENNEDDLIERNIEEVFVSKLVPDGKGGFKLETKASQI